MLSSSIIKKAVMAITGLLLIGFLVTHFAANLLLFVSEESYNLYSHKLVSNPLIYFAEAFLLLVFLFHVFIAIKITLENRGARPMAYDVSTSLGKKTLASSTMMWSGSFIFIFLVLHLVSFKFGADVAPPNAEGIRNLHALVVARFANKFYSLFYIICMIILGFHLSHAIQSSLRTLGLSHPKYLKYSMVFSCLLGIAFTIGFCIFPVYFGFIRKG